jgi:hypothetical protein
MPRNLNEIYCTFMNSASGRPLKTTHSIILFDSLWYQLMRNLELSVLVFTYLIFSYNKEYRFLLLFIATLFVE